jgi:fumarylacetoacetate (FAA) hydrolase family protein
MVQPVQADHGAWPHSILPEDGERALLLGRLDFGAGPTPVLIRDGRVFDISAYAPTVADFLAGWEPGGTPPEGVDRGSLADLLPRPGWEDGAGPTRLLSPIDLQCIKAAGVTFAISALERVIEEKARGDAGSAQGIRENLQSRIGTDLRQVQPGSETAAKLKAALIADGLWSQYLEVAIGPDAEVFTKGPTLSSVGAGAFIGVRPDSAWNNPEPEIVLVVDKRGRTLGATLGNDVNLRDFEGRSALLLSKAKDNNASCALGPFIRLFDSHFGIDDVRSAEVTLKVKGPEGYELSGRSNMAEISRDPLDIVKQTIGANHQYPDGFVLFLGTLFAPIEDRDAPGQGFTHKVGDEVTIASRRLGMLVNRVTTTDKAPPWTFGLSDLFRNLAGRGLLPATGR